MEIINRVHSPRVSTRSMTRNFSTVIHKTHELLQELNRHSPRLVDLYRRHQGPPFNRSSFQPPSHPIPGLPAVTHGEEEAEEEGAWLLSDHRAYAGLAHHLGQVLEDQRELNPGQASLLDELAYFAVNARGLAANLERLLTGLGHRRPGPGRHREGRGTDASATGASDWEKKLYGLEVCARCARWLRASEVDFAALVTKYC
ncbi:cardiotrophin-1-like [Heterodontus francisci]|uniref:cardiotrophin-1-like n=1 Tax=Heterodontus francisci TaxID=7792 RepID=UPI00355BEABD